MNTALDAQAMVEERWRLNISTFAQTASRGQWRPFRWLDLLLSVIQPAIVRGGARIIINAPPRHGKSEAFSHWLPTWFLEWFPEQRVILTSYSDTFAAHWGRKVRDELQRNELLSTRVSDAKRETSDWETVDGGGMKTAGAQGGVTGRGASLIIIDDPVKDWEEANSPTVRRKIIERFNADLYTRLEPGGSIVVVMTRWHEEDLTGYLVDEHADDWQHVALPAVAEDNDPLGRAPGEALCPERFDADDLQRIKLAPGEGLGTQLFNGLYQQHPSPPEGGAIKRAWFRWYRELPRCSQLIQSWDLTFTVGTSYVVGQVWGYAKPNFYLVDQFRAKVDFPGTLDAIRAMSSKHPLARDKVVERAANGEAVLATLKHELDGVVGVRPVGSKEARLLAVSGLLEAGNVYLPEGKPWVREFVEEVVSFPNAKNDDQCDAMTQALSRLSRRSISNIVIPLTGSRTRPTDFARASA